MITGSAVLDTGKTPAEWCEIIAIRGVAISERTLRSKARQIGACHIIGKGMLITPEQIDRIFAERTCYRRLSREGRIRRNAAPNVTHARSPATFEAAMAHLQKACER